MRSFKLGLLAAAALFVLSGLEAKAQTGTTMYWLCRPASTGVDAGYCPVAAATPLPTTASGSGTSTVNLGQVNGATVDVGVGAAGLGTARVSTSSDSTIGTVTSPVGLKGLDGSTIMTGFNPLAVVIAPSTTLGVSTQSCSVACASTIISGGHAAYGISASATVTGWLLVYDATSCSANGTVTPKKAFAYTVANSTLGISWSDTPMIQSTGLAVCFSTTGPYTATASTTAFLSVDYK